MSRAAIINRIFIANDISIIELLQHRNDTFSSQNRNYLLTYHFYRISLYGIESKEKC